MKTKDQAETAKGQQVIEEAASLLRPLRFSQNRGAYAEGRHVAVSIDPRWNEDSESIRVLVTCQAFGHRHVNWARLPVQVLSESGGVHAIARLDARGQASLPQLPLGEYRVSLRVKPAGVSPVLSHRLERLAAQGEDEPTERNVWRGEDEATSILWTIEETEDGDVQVAFETGDAQLAGRTIAFHLIDQDSKRVQHSRRLALEPTRIPGKWEGWCVLGSRTEVHGPYELVFELVPPGEVE